MRNYWFPKHIARYVVQDELKEVKKQELFVERDVLFRREPPENKKQAEEAVADGKSYEPKIEVVSVCLVVLKCFPSLTRLSPKELSLFSKLFYQLR